MKKVSETLAAPIIACMVNTVVSNRDRIVERMNGVVADIMNYPDPTIEHLSDTHSILTYKWEEATLTFDLTWTKSETGLFKLTDMKYAMGD